MTSPNDSPPGGTFLIQAQERVVFGQPVASVLPGEIEQLGARRVMVTSSNSLSKLSDGPLQWVQRALGPRLVGTFTSIRAHSPREDVIALEGFSLHAAVRCAAHERDSLERLCRYITRPALANERVRCNGAGQVVLTLKTPWRDGTTHLVMSPQEFMQRLAALVPRLRLHLIRFHGVLAPNARLRAQVVPKEPPEPAQATLPEAGEAKHAHRTERPSWVRLLKRVFDLDLAHCPNCGGELKIIAAILDRPVIQKILAHLSPQARAPPRAPARGQMPLYWA